MLYKEKTAFEFLARQRNYIGLGSLSKVGILFGGPKKSIQGTLTYLLFPIMLCHFVEILDAPVSNSPNPNIIAEQVKYNLHSMFIERCTHTYTHGTTTIDLYLKKNKPQ